VRDNILDTDIYGTGHTRGAVTVEFLPCDDAALMDLVMTAQIQAQTVGYHGPVQLHNTSTSCIVARKRLVVDAAGIRCGPAESENRTDSTLDDITTKFQRPLVNALVRRAAHRRYARDAEQAREISETHVNDRVAHGLDLDAEPRLAKANHWYREEFRQSLEKGGISLEQLTLRTTATTLTAGHRLGDAVPALAPPPDEEAPSDGSVRLHESYVNALGTVFFAGRIYSEDSFREEFGSLFGSSRRPPSPPDGRKSLKITFAARDPVEVRFAADTVTILMRGEAFEVDTTAYPGMWITAAYRVEKTATGFRAVRQGEIAIAPPNHTPGTRLTSSQVSTKAVLRNHLEDILKPQWELKEINLPERLKKAGPLVPTEIRAARGWLTVGVRCAP
jgi:hypothetical protein